MDNLAALAAVKRAKDVIATKNGTIGALNQAIDALEKTNGDLTQQVNDMTMKHAAATNAVPDELSAELESLNDLLKDEA